MEESQALMLALIKALSGNDQKGRERLNLDFFRAMHRNFAESAEAAALAEAQFGFVASLCDAASRFASTLPVEQRAKVWAAMQAQFALSSSLFDKLRPLAEDDSVSKEEFDKVADEAAGQLHDECCFVRVVFDMDCDAVGAEDYLRRTPLGTPH